MTFEDLAEKVKDIVDKFHLELRNSYQEEPETFEEDVTHTEGFFRKKKRTVRKRYTFYYKLQGWTIAYVDCDGNGYQQYGSEGTKAFQRVVLKHGLPLYGGWRTIYLLADGRFMFEAVNTHSFFKEEDRPDLEIMVNAYCQHWKNQYQEIKGHPQPPEPEENGDPRIRHVIENVDDK